MIHCYDAVGKAMDPEDLAGDADTAVVWIDIVEPTPEEERFAARALGVTVPTIEDMAEIEASSRLYRDGEALFMTATLLAGSGTDLPTSSAVTFILKHGRLITLRHSKPQPFSIAPQLLQRTPVPDGDGEHVFLTLIEAIVDRLADILERVTNEMEHASREVFARNARLRRRREYDDLLRSIGRSGDLTSMVRDSLVSLGRLVAFARIVLESRDSRPVQARLKVIARDVRSITEHGDYVSGKVNFALNATLGLIGLEQNQVMKIFSVVATIFLPPTLIASIYGMNFEIMPELSWPWGYPAALVLMFLSAVLPYVFFRRKGWT